jgi:hypothetical protein
MKPHLWFNKHHTGLWAPFTAIDTGALEAALETPDAEGSTTTDNGRYEVDVAQRTRTPVYWPSAANEVRRCLWYVGVGDEMFPLPETQSELVEASFASAWQNQTWKVQLPMDDGAVIQLVHNNFFVYYPPVTSEQVAAGGERKPKSLRRGWSEEIQTGHRVGEKNFDHCVLVVSSLFTALPKLEDLGFKNVGAQTATLTDCVDTLRAVSEDVARIHFQIDPGKSKSSNMVEYLPVVCEELAELASNGIASGDPLLLSTTRNLRRFLARGLMDSAVYGEKFQLLLDATTRKIDAVAKLFKERNPGFQGTFQLVGYGFGSCLLFDILSHQADAREQAAASVAKAEAEVQPQVLGDLPGQDVSGGDGANDSSGNNDEEEEEEEAMPPPPPLVAPTSNSALPSGVTIESLLGELGFAEYAEKFSEEEIDLETLLEFSSSDFKELGISMGKRKKIMAAVAKLQSSSTVDAAAAQTAWEEEMVEWKAVRAERRLEKRRIAAERAEKSLRAAQQAAAEESNGGGSSGGGGGGNGAGGGGTTYPLLLCEARNLFMLGSPIGSVLATREREERSAAVRAPFTDVTGRQLRVYNIFHPYDPLASRLEGIITEEAIGVPPLQMPHHMGRKRLHLEFKGYLSKAGKDIKTEVSKFATQAWSSVMERVGGAATAEGAALSVAPASPVDDVTPTFILPPFSLNNGDRLDFALQENTLEVFNERLMSMSTHSCYWNSRDAILFMLNTMYGLPAV